MEKEIKRGRKKKEIDGDFAKLLSELLQKVKTENGIIQDDVAKAIGVSRQALGKWANGETVPDIIDLKKLAKYFNVSADYLLGLTNNKTTDTDLQAVCKYTKLSEQAVKSILGISLSYDLRYSKALDLTISSPEFAILIFAIREWLNIMDLRQDAICIFKQRIIEYEGIPPKDIIRYAAELSLSKESCVKSEADIVMKYQSDLDYLEYVVQQKMKKILERFSKEALDNGKHNPPKE